MSDEQKIDLGFEEEKEAEESLTMDSASRARNRTVMLTPEITGEVRARLAKDFKENPAAGQDLTNASSAQPTVGGAQPGRPSQQTSKQSAAGLQGFRGSQAAQVAPGNRSSANPLQEGIFWHKETSIIGFLVSYDTNKNGEFFELRTGRLIVTSEAPGAGSYLVINHETVSPMHAIIRVSEDGDVQVLDQLSEYGTKINRFKSGEVEELSGEKSSLMHGDIISFGDRSFYVCIVPKREEECTENGRCKEGENSE
ncbi:MAG: FHA domain-containing protein [Candidatus Dadabacteria bacterium]|nr:MAG: FHA domain-containing protein [Candidatus Dadabacteria bacterium]